MSPLDPDGVWEAVCTAIREVTSAAPEPSWALAVAALGPERIATVCGLAPQPHYSVAKWCWLAIETPETYRRAATLACFGDLISVRLESVA